MDAVTGFFTSVATDYFLLGGIVLISALDSLRSGIGRTAALAVALPVAFLLYSLISSAAGVGSMLTGATEAGAFVVLLVISYLLVRRMGLEYVDGAGQPLQAALAALSLVIIVAVVWFEMPALHSLWQFGEQLQSIFAEQFRFFWLLGAYAALAFARG